MMAGLPWFKQQVDLRRDPRALILGDILGDPRAWTYVVEMRMYLAENAPTGCVSGTHADIAFERGAGWSGARGVLLGALRDAGFVRAAPAREDGGIEIEDLDWVREQGSHVAKFQRDAKKPDGRSHKVVNPARDIGGSVAAPAREPRGESRELRVESREEDLFGAASASPPPVKPRKAKKEPTGDPRHALLVKALVGAGFDFDGGRDAAKVKELLGLADGEPTTSGDAAAGEILRRAKIALSQSGFYSARTISDFRQHWGRFKMPERGRGPAPPSDFENPQPVKQFAWLEKPE